LQVFDIPVQKDLKGRYMPAPDHPSSHQDVTCKGREYQCGWGYISAKDHRPDPATESIEYIIENAEYL